MSRARRVLDLGCGTGRLTLGIAAAGHTVTGVDPAAPSLVAARAKPGAEWVNWLEGTAADLPDATFDVAVMTSHVAQFFVQDEEWRRALTDLRRAIVPGGRVVFDSRDPRARGWELWNPVDSRREVALPGGVDVVVYGEVTDVTDNVVRSTAHYSVSTGDVLSSSIVLRFRTEEELRSSLRDAGFAVEQIYGGWSREPIGADDGEFLVIARAE